MIQGDFYKVCFDSLLEGLCITDKEGKIIANNSSLEEIFGYNEGELHHKNIELLISLKSKKVHKIHLKTYFNSPKKYRKGKGREFLGLHKNGSILNVEIGLNYFNYKNKSYAKALITDISSRKKDELKIKALNINLEKEVKQQTNTLINIVTKLKASNKKLKEEIQEKILAKNKAKIAFNKEKELNLLQTKFLSLASHEFKTPLSGILTSVSLIDKYNKKKSNEHIENHVYTIKKLVYQLNTVLDDFLFLEKTETKALSYHFTNFHFFEFISEIIKNSKSVLKKGQKIKFTPSTNEVEVYQDKKITEIIIRNILYNAIKYSPEDSKIEIHVSKNEHITIIVKDNGIGIPANDQKHIFERFFRAKNTLHFQGTGIGLNIVKHHVNEFGGLISVESHEHVGTTVTIKLPIIMGK